MKSIVFQLDAIQDRRTGEEKFSIRPRLCPFNPLSCIEFDDDTDAGPVLRRYYMTVDGIVNDLWPIGTRRAANLVKAARLMQRRHGLPAFTSEAAAIAYYLPDYNAQRAAC